MAGDRIVNVDDSLFVGKKLNNELAMRTLKGPKGSQVKLGVKRVGEPKLLDFTITRGDIPQNLSLIHILHSHRTERISRSTGTGT